MQEKKSVFFPESSVIFSAENCLHGLFNLKRYYKYTMVCKWMYSKFKLKILSSLPDDSTYGNGTEFLTYVCMMFGACRTGQNFLVHFSTCKLHQFKSLPEVCTKLFGTNFYLAGTSVQMCTKRLYKFMQYKFIQGGYMSIKQYQEAVQNYLVHNSTVKVRKYKSPQASCTKLSGTSLHTKVHTFGKPTIATAFRLISVLMREGVVIYGLLMSFTLKLVYLF